MVREWLNGNRRILAMGMALVFLMNITACGNGTRWIFSLNGERLNHTDVDAFGFVYAMDHNIVNEGQMEEVYEDGDTYEEYYKQSLEDEIVSTILLWQQAKTEGIKLDKEQIADCKEQATRLMDTYGKKRMQNNKLDLQTIEEVYEKKALGEQYVEQMSESDGSEEQPASRQDERYVEVYEMLFPTVEFDADGMLRSDADGAVIQVAADVKQEQYDYAKELAQKASEGESLDRLVSAYGDRVKASKKHLRYADLDADYKKAVDGLKENDISGVVEGTYGYYVVQLLQEDAGEYAKQVADYEQQSRVQDKRQEMIDQLYDAYVGTDKDYRNDKRWDAIAITDYLQ